MSILFDVSKFEKGHDGIGVQGVERVGLAGGWMADGDWSSSKREGESSGVVQVSR